MLDTKEREILKQAATLILRETDAGETLQVRGFGTFKRVARAAKTGRNPKTGGTVEIPARTTLTFKVSKGQVVAE
jgi:DNA-binding protein HU-beta